MQVHFCDLCNESVPQSDLDGGRAFVRKGRVVCASCDAAMGGPGGLSELFGSSAPGASERHAGGGLALAPPPVDTQRTTFAAEPKPTRRADRPPGRSGALLGALTGLIALAFAVGATALLVERADDLERELARLGTLERGLEHVDAQRADADRTLQRRLSALEERSVLDGERRADELASALAALGSELGERDQRLATLAGELDALRAGGARVAELDQRVAGAVALVRSLEEQSSFHDDKLIELEERLRGMSQGGGLAALAAGPPAAEPGQPTWQGWLADLANQHAGIRLEAIYALGETRDPGVVPYIVPMLGDVDLFVRMAAARMLEDLKAWPAVPALIDALEDPDAAVTEAAMLALHAITGQDFGFEPSSSSKSDRERAIKAWRDWWKREGERRAGG